MANTDKYTIDETTLNDIKNEGLTEEAKLNQMYGLQADGTFKGGLVGETEKTYNDLIQKQEDLKTEQTKIQEDSFKHATNLLEQDKEDAEKDFKEETANSYADYKRATDRYGVEAERMAAAGLLHSGYSESYKSRAYIAHQNRVATARTVLEEAKRNYTNKMAEAVLANSSALAQIAKDTLEKQTELSISLLTERNGLIANLATQKQQTRTYYLSKWQSELDKLNKEAALKLQADEYALKEREVKIAEEKWAQEKAEYEDSLIADSGYKSQGRAATERARAKRESQNTIPSTTVIKAKEPTVDQASLNNVKTKLAKVGVFCNNAEQLNEAIRRGFVIEEKKNGKLYYKVASNLINSKSNLPSSFKKRFGISNNTLINTGM